MYSIGVYLRFIFVYLRLLICATDRAAAGEVTVISGQCSLTGHRGVDKVLVERRIVHLQTDNCSNSLSTVVVDHERTAGRHHRQRTVILAR